MTSYRKIKILIFVTLMSYAMVGVILQLFVSGRNEIFPIFSWALFSKVPNNRIDYNVQITSVNNKKLVLPVYYNNSSKWFSNAKSINAYYVIQKLGYAVTSGDENRIHSVRKYFEPLYMGDVKSVNYKVVQRTFDPLRLWKFGETDSIKTLDSFEYYRKKR